MPEIPGAGVASPVRNLARTLLSFVETRARLAANEIEEHSLRLTEVALWVLAALACAGVALVMLSLLVVLLFRDGERLLAAAIVAAVWTVAAVACVLVARARQRERPRPLSTTLSELHKDRERLGNPDA